MAFYKFIMSCIHHYNTTQNSFTFPSLPPSHDLLATTDLFTGLYSLASPRMPYICGQRVYCLFRLSSKMAVSFCTPTSNEGQFLLFHILNSIWCHFFFFLDFRHSNRCVEVFHCCFNLQFPNDIMVSNFSCLFAICTSSSVRNLFITFVHV